MNTRIAHWRRHVRIEKSWACRIMYTEGRRWRPFVWSSLCLLLVQLGTLTYVYVWIRLDQNNRRETKPWLTCQYQSGSYMLQRLYIYPSLTGAQGCRNVKFSKTREEKWEQIKECAPRGMTFTLFCFLSTNITTSRKEWNNVLHQYLKKIPIQYFVDSCVQIHRHCSSAATEDEQMHRPDRHHSHLVGQLRPGRPLPSLLSNHLAQVSNHFKISCATCYLTYIIFNILGGSRARAALFTL